MFNDIVIIVMTIVITIIVMMVQICKSTLYKQDHKHSDCLMLLICC